MTAAGEGASCSTRSAWTRWTPVATTTELPGIVSRKLFQEPFAADVGASHRLAGRQRISVADLSPEDLWLLADGHCFRTQAMSLCRQRGRARAALRATMVVTRRRIRRADVTIGGSVFHVARDSNERIHGLSPVWRNNSRVLVSSVARTILDACAHPGWVGGGGQLIAIFRAAVEDGLTTPESILSAARDAPSGAALGRLAVLVDRYWPSATDVATYVAEHRGTGYARFDPGVNDNGSLNTRRGIWLNVGFETDTT